MKLQETIDMTKQQLSQPWKNAKTVWNTLATQGKIYPTDHEGFLSFERFYSNFIEKNNREPTVDETIKIYLKNSPTHMSAGTK